MPSGEVINVYCSFTSGSGITWTLIESFALKNHEIYKQQPFTLNFPRNESNHQWEDYRLSRNAMSHIKSNAILWAASCCYEADGFVARDFIKGIMGDTDVLSLDGSQCAFVLQVNVRGIACRNCTAYVRQTDTRHAYVDSLSKLRGCQWDGISGVLKQLKDGAVYTDSYFGFYHVYNPLHRCTASPSSTTQWWLGAVQSKETVVKNRINRIITGVNGD